jgi:hypothetical protein
LTFLKKVHLLWIIFLGIFLAVQTFAADSAPTGAAPTRGAPKNVLILHSYHAELPWTRAIGEAMQAVFSADPMPIAIHTEFMDTKRIFEAAYLAHLFHLYTYKYAHKQIDIVLTSDDHAFNFITAHRETLFPEVPVVFCGVNNLDPSKIDPHATITGVVEAIDIKSNLALARRLHPKAKRIIAIGDQTVSGRANRQLFEKALSETPDPLSVEIWDRVSMADLKQRLAGLSDDTILFWLHFTYDAAGNFFSFEESAEQISAAGVAPLYSFWDFLLGHGIVGGNLISGQAQGEAAARRAVAILSGKPAASIPIGTRSPNRHMFDHAQLIRFGLKVEDLPAGSVILNEPAGLLPGSPCPLGGRPDLYHSRGRHPDLADQHPPAQASRKLPGRQPGPLPAPLRQRRRFTLRGGLHRGQGDHRPPEG